MVKEYQEEQEVVNHHLDQQRSNVQLQVHKFESSIYRALRGGTQLKDSLIV